jgi:hypothetical protein
MRRLWLFLGVVTYSLRSPIVKEPPSTATIPDGTLVFIPSLTVNPVPSVSLYFHPVTEEYFFEDEPEQEMINVVNPVNSKDFTMILSFMKKQFIVM